MTLERQVHRAGGRSARRALRKTDNTAEAPPSFTGGLYKPLSEREVERIHHTALDILDKVGMANPLPILQEKALAKGCRIDEHGRLRFPPALVEDVIAATPKTFVAHGLDPNHDHEYAPGVVSFGPGGDSVSTLDSETRSYRPSTLLDVYDFARLTDRLEHIHTFSRVVVATEIADLYAADINIAYASAAGTAKHISLSPNDAEHLDGLVALMNIIAGGEDKARQRPFFSAGGCPVVSPLAYGDDNSAVCVEASKSGPHVWAVVAPQAGATAPAALAGTLVQVMAETLAALLLIQLVNPGTAVSFGPWPFVSDLRSGSFTGGGGEQAILAAAAAQIGNFYEIPSSVGAGMSDAKWPDAQMGYEKGVTVTMAALAGADVSETCGMMASLMGCSFEAMVIDNDMVGNISRALRGIEVTDETLSFDVIEEVVHGPGHFLGHAQTLDLMESGFTYPHIADRTAQGVWQEEGSPDVVDAARARAREILSTHYPEHIDTATDKKIRENFEILLPEETMRANGGRW